MSARIPSVRASIGLRSLICNQRPFVKGASIFFWVFLYALNRYSMQVVGLSLVLNTFNQAPLQRTYSKVTPETIRSEILEIIFLYLVSKTAKPSSLRRDANPSGLFSIASLSSC